MLPPLLLQNEVLEEAFMAQNDTPVSRRAFAKIGAAAAAGIGTTSVVGAQSSNNVAETLQSEFLMLLRFEYPDRIPGTTKPAGLPGMRRGIVPISKGTFEGPRLKGT